MHFYLVAFSGLFLMILERIFPDNRLANVPKWWFRVIFLNCLQMGIAIGVGVWLDPWFQTHNLFHLRDYNNPVINGFISYFVITFVFYWWHRWRHELNFFWLLCHQMHHSASRIETITSFYKHPIEILLNSIIIGSVNYILLGVSVEGAAWCLLFSAIGEYAYHMNIKTPRWWGYIFQRPEMHRIHHELGKHTSNFSDFPIWDIMFGTFRNPEKFPGPCGFKPQNEQRFWSILFFKNVNGPYVPKRKKVRAK